MHFLSDNQREWRCRPLRSTRNRQREPQSVSLSVPFLMYIINYSNNTAIIHTSHAMYSVSQKCVHNFSVCCPGDNLALYLNASVDSYKYKHVPFTFWEKTVTSSPQFLRGFLW